MVIRRGRAADSEKTPSMPVTRLLLLLSALFVLGSCADNYVPKSEPSFYRNLARPGAELDAAAAASMISRYRSNNGFSAVELDSGLMHLAKAQSEVMVERDKLEHAADK